MARHFLIFKIISYNMFDCQTLIYLTNRIIYMSSCTKKWSFFLMRIFGELEINVIHAKVTIFSNKNRLFKPGHFHYCSVGITIRSLSRT